MEYWFTGPPGIVPVRPKSGRTSQWTRSWAWTRGPVSFLLTHSMRLVTEYSEVRGLRSRCGAGDGWWPWGPPRAPPAPAVLPKILRPGSLTTCCCSSLARQLDCPPGAAAQASGRRLPHFPGAGTGWARGRGGGAAGSPRGLPAGRCCSWWWMWAPTMTRAQCWPQAQEAPPCASSTLRPPRSTHQGMGHRSPLPPSQTSAAVLGGGVQGQWWPAHGVGAAATRRDPR